MPVLPLPFHWHSNCLISSKGCLCNKVSICIYKKRIKKIKNTHLGPKQHQTHCLGLFSLSLLCILYTTTYISYKTLVSIKTQSNKIGTCSKSPNDARCVIWAHFHRCQFHLSPCCLFCRLQCIRNMHLWPKQCEMCHLGLFLLCSFHLSPCHLFCRLQCIYVIKY